MSKRLIIDSLKHLVECYDVDGFRFDLAELLGIDVLSDIEHELKSIKPGIILIAEPWSFRGHIGKDLKYTGYASWNDGFRDFMASYLRGTGDAQGIQYYMTGCLNELSAFPAQSVNYVESHDDYCWIDRITENENHDGRNPTDADRRRTHIMLAILMSSIGIPMISQGQDMLRSKEGIHNTYLRGDVNALRYDQAREHKNTHEYFKAWIHLRLSDLGRLFRLYDMPSEHYFRFYKTDNLSATAILYNADCSHGGFRLLFAVNPHADATTTIHLNEHRKEDWIQIADHHQVNANGIETDMFQETQLTLPPLSCGLWKENTLCKL